MILVTGAAGLSGSAVVREFARQGARVRALVRSRDKAAALTHLPTVEVVEGDMANPGTLAAAFDGVDRTLLISSANPQMLETQCAFIDAFADALYEQATERLRNPRATVHLETHAAFGVNPTTFAEFAKRNAPAFRGEAAAFTGGGARGPAS
jgi:uncharacterized protein YbjT (DUF2867 family)